MSEPRTCEREGCDKPAGQTGICHDHEFELVSDVLAGIGRINDYLRLRAEFEAWCVANNQPSPND